MNYYELVDEVLENYQHPCDAEVPPGFYRRVMWEKYNTTLAHRGPAVQEEWDTEVIKIETRVYDKNPFGLKSDPLPVQMITDPSTGELVSPEIECRTKGIWSNKIGHCFKNQDELRQYVESIGSTLQSDNNWYGADLSKQSLFKHPKELEMYRLENTGAIWRESGYSVDKRTCMRYDVDTKMCTLVDFNNVNSSRSAYLKHYENKPCAYVGMQINTNPDLSIPCVPKAEPTQVDPIPLVFQAICIPAMYGFPYTDIAKSVMDAWNKTRQEFKIFWDSLPGLTEGAGDKIATMYDNLSISMQELGQAALAMSQKALQDAWAEFKKVIKTALNIVGGGWEMLKKFVPKINILGIEIDIVELCTSPDGVQKLKEQILGPGEFSIDEIIDAIYTTMGSAYRYTVEYIKMTARDLVDALTDFYDWCWAQVMFAGVSLCKLLADLAEIWAIPPEIPNPVWLAIRAVKELFKQIPPLDMIMSGNFPGFTTSDIYDFVMKKINEQREIVLAYVQQIEDQIKAEYEELQKMKKELEEKVRYYHQYLKGMWEQVTEALTTDKENEINTLKGKVSALGEKIKNLAQERIDALGGIDNILKMGLNYLKEFPMIKQIIDLLELAGVTIEEIMNFVTNDETNLESMYENFVEGCRNLKDYFKTIVNQIYTLALSKVTQWVNKLLSILSLVIEYPLVAICAPLMKY